MGDTPDQKPPGVTVSIIKMQGALGDRYTWVLYLDSSDGEPDATKLVYHNDVAYSSPEVAEERCRGHLAELVDRLMGWRKGGALAWHDGRFKNITVVRE